MNDLDLARNVFGSLSPELRERIEKFLEYPTEENWNNCYSIIINITGDIMTVWQAVVAVEPTFTKRGPCEDESGKRIRGWPQIPSSQLVRRAIAFAVH